MSDAVIIRIPKSELKTKDGSALLNILEGKSIPTVKGVWPTSKKAVSRRALLLMLNGMAKTIDNDTVIENVETKKTETTQWDFPEDLGDGKDIFRV